MSQQLKEPLGEQRERADAETDKGITLSKEQLQSRRARNVAIGLAIGFFALLFYVVTIAKLMHFGPGFLERPL